METNVVLVDLLNIAKLMVRVNIIVHIWQKGVFGVMLVQMSLPVDITSLDNELIIKDSILEKILNTIGNMKPEQGGIFGGRENKVTHFYWDETAECADNEYAPDFYNLNVEIKNWAEKSVEFFGIIHSHPNGCGKLSENDISVADEILENSKRLKKIYMIILSFLDEIPRLNGYCVMKK